VVAASVGGGGGERGWRRELAAVRRRALVAGGIDIVTTKAGATAGYLGTVVIKTLVPELFKQGFLIAGLRLPFLLIE